MGASIHMHIEVKKNGQWYHYSAPHIFRDTYFFDVVAGVYGRYTPVSPLKGLPKDASFVTTACYNQDKDMCQLHHITWLDKHELKTLSDIIRDRNELATLEHDYFHTYINGNAITSHQGWDDVRLIVWFDN